MRTAGRLAGCQFGNAATDSVHVMVASNGTDVSRMGVGRLGGWRLEVGG